MPIALSCHQRVHGIVLVNALRLLMFLQLSNQINVEVILYPSIALILENIFFDRWLSFLIFYHQMLSSLQRYRFIILNNTFCKFFLKFICVFIINTLFSVVLFRFRSWLVMF